jgi:hypothetical protein
MKSFFVIVTAILETLFCPLRSRADTFRHSRCLRRVSMSCISRINRLRRLSWINAAFTVLLLSSTAVLAQNGQEFDTSGPPSPKEEIEQLFEVTVENAITFRKYDVVIKKRVSMSPIDATDLPVGPVTEVTYARVILDRDERRCLFIRDSIREFERTGKEEHDWDLNYFEAGKWTRRGQRSDSTSINSATLDDVYHKLSVPMPEWVGLISYPCTLSEPYDQRVENRRRSSGGSIRTLPDGTRVYTNKRKENNPNNTVVRIDFDPVSLMPVYFSGRFDHWPSLSNKIQYGEKKGLYFPESIEVSEGNIGYEADTRTYFMEGQGTVTFQWKQLNPDTLEFPSHERLFQQGVKEWKSFVEGEESSLLK